MGQAQTVPDSLKTKYHEFDFWLGEWDVYNYNTNDLAGTSAIQSVIDSIGILEHYSTAKGPYKGKSLNKYNPAKDHWEQFWVDNSGLTLHLTGGLIKGKMVLSDLLTNPEKETINKIVWQRLSEERVRQTWSISKDQGITWQVIFDGEYRPKNPK
ncbi:MAG: hypothetical protein HKP24_03060 [Croceitalea sp.]|nr:hypothetical protein [Croceitalea sp.]NNC33665.1 hypothetical protein [Croceitalea sp.]NNM17527.1 hypothetical protein [Croceitalea sp.]